MAKEYKASNRENKFLNKYSAEVAKENEVKQQYSDSGILDKAIANIASGEADVANKIGGREDQWKKMVANLDPRTIERPRDLLIRPPAIAFQALAGGMQRGEAMAANQAMALQDAGKNIQEKGVIKGLTNTLDNVVTGIGKGMTGEKSGEIGDVYQRAGVHPNVAATLGFLTTAFVSELGSAGNLSQGFKNLAPKAYTDKVMAREGRNIVNVLTNKVDDVRAAYNKVYEPFMKKVVEGKVFSRIEKMLPPKLQKEISRKFSSGIIEDVAGNKSTDIGKLVSLRSWLDDMVKAPSDELARLKVTSKELTEASKNVKNVILQHMPKDQVDEIAKLDDVFSKVYSKSNAWLKRLHDPKTDSIKTEFLARVFKRADYSGSRIALQELGDVGMDINKSLKIFKGYATRQGWKKAIGVAAPTVIAGKMIAGAMGNQNKQVPQSFTEFIGNQ